MQRLILYATSSLFSITICTKLFRSFDRYIPILTLNFEGILCLISRINALFIVFIRHDFAKFLRNIDFTCFCLYRKICKCFFRNTECNITKAAANLILTGKCNILGLYITISHFNLTIGKYNIFNLQITEIIFQLKILKSTSHNFNIAIVILNHCLFGIQ